jgi:hypothetical protein
LGASGSERQANLSYNFKQIVNSMFPAMYRYLQSTAYHGLDLFADSKEELGAEGTWTAELFATMRLED